jgi:hypothetical protein
MAQAPPLTRPTSRAMRQLRRAGSNARLSHESLRRSSGTIAVVTSNPDTLPTPADLSGPCPRCGRISNFNHEAVGFLRADAGGPLESVAVLRCMGCKDGTAIVHTRDGTGLHWYPAPGAGQLDPAVPPAIASCYDEGMRCLGIAANRAAAVMFRSVLTLFIKDKGTEMAKAERHLKTALKNMKEDGGLHASLWDWADHLNQLGNEGAHPEDYDDVTDAEAQGLADFVRHLLRHEYEMPAQLAAARARSAASGATST